MRTIISATLATLFVFLAGFNVWNMLSNRGKTPRASRLWTQIHHAAGYIFIGLFVIIGYFMLMRVKGQSDELSPRIVLHMAMALSLAPLLLAKVIAARYQKAQRGLLMGLGISIFAVAFTLVAVNLVIHYLRLASTDKAPASSSEAVIGLVLVGISVAFFAGARRPKPKSAPTSLPPDKTSALEPQGRPDELTLTLARIENQTHDAKTLRFLLPPNQHVEPRPGQFLTFDWIINGKTVKRSYTICSSATQRGYIEITPKRVETGYVSKFLNDQAKVGLTVKARGPYGKFHFDETKHKKIVLIAGGSGITPMIAMLRYIDDLSINADVTLIYCVRTEHDVFFKNELAALQTRLNNFRYVLVLSQPHAEWKGLKGRLQRETLDRTVEKPSESTFFMCGPPPFMDLGRSLLKDMGVDSSRVLQESFGSGVAGEKHSPISTGPLQVTLLRSAQTCSMSSSQTLLESLEQNGVLIPSGCRQGICGTCATKLLNGNVRMDNEEALTEELRAQRFILPCVARPVTNITLDA